MSKTIKFRASIAPFASSLKFGGDTGRVTFEVPKSDVPEAVALIALQETALIITVEVDDGETGANAGKSTKIHI